MNKVFNYHGQGEATDQTMSAFGRGVSNYFENKKNGREISDQENEYRLQKGKLCSAGHIKPWLEAKGEISLYFSRYNEWPIAEREVLEFADIDNPILDFGAGTGRHSLFLQELGAKQVYAVDGSPEICGIARQRGVKKVFCADINWLNNELLSSANFKTMLIMHNSIGHAKDWQGFNDFLDTAHNISVPEARMILTVRNPLHVDSKKIFRERGTEIVRVKWNGTIGSWFRFLLIPFSMFEKIAFKKGWKVIFATELDSLMYGVVLEKIAFHNKKIFT